MPGLRTGRPCCACGGVTCGPRTASWRRTICGPSGPPCRASIFRPWSACVWPGWRPLPMEVRGMSARRERGTKGSRPVRRRCPIPLAVAGWRAFWEAWGSGWRCSSWSRACGAGASVRPCWRILPAAIPGYGWTSMNRTRRPGLFMPAGVSRWWAVPRWTGRGSRIRSCICAGYGPGMPEQGMYPAGTSLPGLSLPCTAGRHSAFAAARARARRQRGRRK